MEKTYIVKKAFQAIGYEQFMIDNRISEKIFARNGMEKIERFLKRGYIAEAEKGMSYYRVIKSFKTMSGKEFRANEVFSENMLNKATICYCLKHGKIAKMKQSDKSGGSSHARHRSS